MDTSIWDLFLHLDDHLQDWILAYGNWTYLALFLMVFLETAVIFMAFLPGDTLLFTAGMMAAVTGLHIELVILCISVAAILGNTVAYVLGIALSRAAVKTRGRWASPTHLAQAHQFFAKWGGWSITMCRFYPILRSITPLAAGLARMPFRQFTFYNIAGGLLWGSGIPLLGFFFGNIPVIKNNMILIAMTIVVISLIPFAVSFFKRRLAKSAVKSPS